MKACSRCKLIKPFSDFSALRRRPCGLACECRACATLARQIAYGMNPEERRQKTREWRERDAEKTKISRRASYVKNLEKTKQLTKRWKAENPGKVLASRNSRRCAELKRCPKWLTPEDFSYMEGLYTFARYCKLALGEAYHVDHILPLCGKYVSGLHVPSNLQIISASENLRKSNNWKPE